MSDLPPPTPTLRVTAAVEAVRALWANGLDTQDPTDTVIAVLRAADDAETSHKKGK